MNAAHARIKQLAVAAQEAALHRCAAVDHELKSARARVQQLEALLRTEQREANEYAAWLASNFPGAVDPVENAGAVENFKRSLVAA